MTQRLFSLVLLLVFPFALWSQSPGVCGTVEPEEFMDNIKALKEWIAEGNLSTRGNTLTYVPVKFHIISKADGTKGISEVQVLDALCHLNESFMDQDIQFYIYNGFKYIKNDAAYANPGDVPLILNGNKDSKAMNVFIGENATPQGGGLGVTLGYFDPSQDWLVVKKSEINGFSSTLPHEVGHYFNLAHPFRGWDCTYWQAAEHGNPVNSLTAPCNPNVLVEFANGDNCATAADLLCDTPADYNFGFNDDNDCVYNFDCLDPNGDEMAPMENNFMAYFSGCAQYVFTEQQKDVMAARLIQRAGLNTSFTPGATTIESAPTLVQPANGSTSPAYNNVAFEWTPVAGANQYLLEIDLASNFSVAPIRHIVWGNYKVVQGLLSNKKYFWRVRPFNQYQTCTPNSVRWDFTTGTATNTIEPSYVTNWSVRPNPVAAGQSLQLEMNTNESFEASVTLRTLSGQTVQSVQTSFAAGNSTLDIPTYGMANGIYFLTVQSEGGMINERIIIAN